MSKRKGVSSPGPEGFFRTWSNRTSFGFSFPLVGTEAGASICTDVVSSVAFSYCFKYDFLDRVPVGWGISARVVQACFFPSESLRKVAMRLSSSGRMEITLQDLPFDLDFFESRCSSWTRSGFIHMIFPISNVKRTRPLFSWVLAFRGGWFKLFSWLFGYLSLPDQFFSGMGFDSPHMNFYLV